MKKKVLALVLAAAMASSMATSVSVFAEAATPRTVADLPAEAQFEPNADYDEYTVVEYTIEDIQARPCLHCIHKQRSHRVLP